MVFYLIDINKKQVDKTLNKLLNTNSKKANKDLNNSVNKYFASRYKNKGLPNKSGKLTLTDKDKGPLVQSIVQELRNNSNFSNDVTQSTLQLGEGSVSSGELPGLQKSASFSNLFKSKTVNPEQIEAVINKNKLTIINDILKRPEIKDKLRFINFPILLPNGKVYSVIAKDLRFKNTDFNLVIKNSSFNKNSLSFNFMIELNTIGVRKIIDNFSNELSQNAAEGVLSNLSSKYKQDEELIGILLAVKSQSIRIGFSDSGLSKSIFSTILLSDEDSLVDTVSNQLNALNLQLPQKELQRRVKISMAKKMPKGPERGEPLSSSILTNRTGTFLKSIDVFYNFRANAISYFYNPNYFVHERTSRDPRQDIEGSITNVIKRITNKKFRIFKANK